MFSVYNDCLWSACMEKKNKTVFPITVICIFTFTSSFLYIFSASHNVLHNKHVAYSRN